MNEPKCSKCGAAMTWTATAPIVGAAMEWRCFACVDLGSVATDGNQQGRSDAVDPAAPRTVTGPTRDLKCVRCLELEADRDHAREEREKAEAALQREQRAHLETIDQRDRAEEAADNLAYAIAPLEVIGEHSNMNDPWSNALDALGAERTQHAEALGGKQVSFSAEEQRAEKAEADLLSTREELATLKWEVENAHAGRQAEQLRREAAEETCARLQPYVQHGIGCEFSTGLVRDAFGWHTRAPADPPAICTCGLIPVEKNEDEETTASEEPIA